MAGEDSASFTGSIPEHYDAGLGPVIFAGYAADLARRVAAAAPRSVLETAAGTGIVTRLLRSQLPPETSLTATDLNAPMLEVARRKFRLDERVAFRTADATALPFADGKFDAVVCQFGVMFFPDKDQAYREARRVLAPGGHYFFNVWDAHAHNRFAKIVHELVGGFFPHDPPQFYQIPFSCHQVEPIRAGLLAAGFAGIRTEVVALEQDVRDVGLFARGLVFGNPLSEQIRARGGVDPALVAEAVATALRRELSGDRPRIRLQAITYEAS